METPRTAQPEDNSTAAQAAIRARLLIVEDDSSLRPMLHQYFESEGQIVESVASAESMFERLAQSRPDLIVLDINLPGMSGLEACEQLRRNGDRVPVILLTARTEEVDRVGGLEGGADDYVPKPFSARELLARVRAVLRRTAVPAGVPLPTDAKVQIGEQVFVLATRSLHRGSAVRVLTTVEYTMLAELVQHPGVPVSRERLLEVSHSAVDAALERTVDVAIVRLRRLVEPQPLAPRFIQTVRGHGYMFVPHDRAVSAEPGAAARF